MTCPGDEVRFPAGDFRSEVIYFIVVDRFHDGNPFNTGTRAELNDPTRQQWTKYWGGDLQGILDKVDYLQGLGVTALWLTPLFEQVEGMHEEHVPNHGYWAQDFKRINERWVNDAGEVRLFTRNDTVLDRLIARLHDQGMKLVLDVVCNHSSPATDQGKGRLFDDGRLLADFNDDAEGWYHHYEGITDWKDEWQLQNCELEGLATFNENNVLYRRHVTQAMKLWLDKGVDALRIDTVKHMPLWFWQEFSSEMQLHKPDAFLFGEWINSHPDNPSATAFANLAGMSILDFGLCHAIRGCLGERSEAGFRIVQAVLDQDHQYRSATELVTFFENHDMPRLQSLHPDPAALQLATVLILTARGIPCIYYGSEQYLHDDTEDGKDPYNRPMMQRWDTDTPMYRLVAVLGAERKLNLALQWGGHWPKAVEPDLYVYLRRYGTSRLLVILNRGGARELTVPDVELPDGAHRCLLSGREAEVKDGAMSQVSVAAGAALVFSVRGEPVRARTVIRVQVHGAPTRPGQFVAVTGGCPELGGWDISAAVRLECVNASLWCGELCFHEAGRGIAYKHVILSCNGDTGPLRENRTARRRQVPADVGTWRDIWEE